MSSTRAWRVLAVALGAALALASASAEMRIQSQSILTAKLSGAIGADARAVLIAAAESAEIHEVTFSAPGTASVDVHLLLKRASTRYRERIATALQSSLRVFTTWYGAVPSAELVVVDVPSDSAIVGASYPQLIAIATRWLAPVRDVTVERAIVAAIARQYLFAAATRHPHERWFDESLALYTGARAMHEVFENGNAETRRYFGGYLPVVIRPVELSPNRADPRPRVRHFREVDEPPASEWRASSAEPGSRAQRGALALHALERYIGWPAMQQALATYRQRASSSGGSPTLFATIVSEQRGTNLSWYFDEAFRPDATFDYALDRLSTEPSPEAPGQFRTTVGLRRLGDAVFAGTNERVTGSYAGGRALPVRVRFEDGSEFDEYWDGRQAERTLSYLSRSPAVWASVDPRAMLVLDRNRGNNTRRLQSPTRPIGTRLALHWIVWLQDLMLSCTALA